MPGLSAVAAVPHAGARVISGEGGARWMSEQCPVISGRGWTFGMPTEAVGDLPDG